MSYNIGVNVVEVDGRATPSIQPAPTSVTGFSILSQRGIPGKVFRVTNWSQFVERFGSYIPEANGAYAVRGFFDNGGATALITRVLNTKSGKGPASITSTKAAPWQLELGSTLSLKKTTKDSNDESVVVTFRESSSAILQGIQTIGDLAGTAIQLEVNGELQEAYSFITDDFTNIAAPTPAEVAAVLNRQFTGIRAWVEEGKLKVATDRKGVDASLRANDTAAELLFEESGKVFYGGNINDLTKTTPAEVLEAIKAQLEIDGVELIVTADTSNLTITHPKAGGGNTLQVIESTTSAHDVFGFDLKVHCGEAGLPAAAGLELNDETGKKGLKVTAGYRSLNDPGYWGNEISISIKTNSEDEETYDLGVLYNGNPVETWEKLYNGDDPKTTWHNPEDVINDEFTGSKYIVVTVMTKGKPEDTDGDIPLTDGDDGCFSNDEEKFNAFAASFDLYKLVDIQLLCCPETDNQTVVTTGLSHCEQVNQQDRIFVGHTPPGYDCQGAKTYGKSFQGAKRYGALYFPWIRVRDPIGAKPKWIPPTGHILGAYARTERERGIWKAPAGNAARLNGALDIEHHITDADHTDLVKNGSVNAVRFIPGQGIVIDSSRTLSTNPLWLYVNVRLLFNFVKSSLKSGLRWVVQEPNDDTLWNKVKYNSVTPFLMGLWRRGAFGPGAPEEVFTVKCDAENNTPENIQQGIFTVEVYFYPSRPAETIVIIVGQQEGGASASEG